MPTGNTADIAKGITFKEYALACARAFGALIMMRDDPSDAPIPDKFQPSDYSAKRLKEAENRTAKLRKMTIAQCRAQALKDFTANERSLKKGLREKAELKAKYEAMLAKVNEYVSPSPDHDGFKKFMRDQIAESIKFDCGGDYYERKLAALGLLTPTQWRNAELDECARDIEYHTKAHAEEVARTNGRNEWIALLRLSLQNAE